MLTFQWEHLHLPERFPWMWDDYCKCTRYCAAGFQQLILSVCALLSYSARMQRLCGMDGR
ncbi:hypothetical protein VFPPC_16595 [Pochonia chlamydosporia 170]|uniref:Uncharacterized protein n=1 Tax=Pochonia chlamydosporia 170 TaxID=1380566 RepID=A0A179F9L0_METCM|nr:hypothetical protein VFPPC_16595 [Pochonia chlamydosporia 170]OAQ62020.1 hypothetical protein VFPPC_16595 [Pochonia chlamydosporia 170]